MRNAFPGYYRPTASEFDELWDSALIAVDANVLLNLYGYSLATRKKLLRLFDRLRDRLWMPHQFASEFQRHRVKAILDQITAYTSVERQLKNVTEKHLTPKRHHPFITKKSMAALATIRKELDKGRLRHEKLLSDDPIFEEITKLLTNRIGTAPTRQDLNRLHAEAIRRYKSRIPPGYADKKKPEPEKFGDYIGWQQILGHCTAKKCSLILVTDDMKEDWWQIRGDRTIGPRPELVEEYMNACEKPFYMYSLEQFTRFAQGHFDSQLGKAALEEIRQRHIESIGAATFKPPQVRQDETDDHAKKSTAHGKGVHDTTGDSDLIERDAPKMRG